MCYMHSGRRLVSNGISTADHVSRRQLLRHVRHYYAMPCQHVQSVHGLHDMRELPARNIQRCWIVCVPGPDSDTQEDCT